MRCHYICFLILYYLLAQKKWKLKNGPRLPTLPYSLRTEIIKIDLDEIRYTKVFVITNVKIRDAVKFLLKFNIKLQ